MEINVLSLPKPRFAHVFEAESYSAVGRTNTSRIEISFIAKGQISIFCNETEYLLKEGDVLCNVFDGSIRMKADGFHCHHTVSATVEFEYVNGGGLMLTPVLKASQHTEGILKLIDGFVYNYERLNSSPSVAASRFLELLCKIDEISRHLSLSVLPSASLYTERAKSYIGRNISKPLTQKQIAEHLGISSGYLCGIFKQVQGISIMQYINRQKLAGVRMLMENENVSLATAAALYGYNDSNYCSRLHKKLFGYNITDRPKWAKQ